MNKFKYCATAVLLVAVPFSNFAYANPMGGATQDLMTDYYKENEKYSCSPEELADFLSERRKGLAISPNLMTGDQFVQNKVVVDQENGVDNCLTLFDNLKIIEDIKKLYSILQLLKMPNFSLDGMGIAAQLLAEQLLAAAMESVCNALTKEAASALINEVMDRKLGFDMDSIKEFDHKKFAKEVATEHAKDYLSSKGVNPNWLDKENHEELLKSELNKQKDKIVDKVFDKK